MIVSGYGEKKTRNSRIDGKYRSKFEANFAKRLDQLKLKANYENAKVSYTVPETTHTYTPDWEIRPGTYIETKGRLTAADRKKILWVRKCNPKITVYLLFQDPRKTLSKSSKTTYGDWCDKNGVIWSDIKDEAKWKGWFNA